MSKWHTYLSNEIIIDYKTCSYFFIQIFYVIIYQLIKHIYSVPILLLFELICLCYIMSYIQVYLFHNFDEADHFGRYESISTIICAFLYTVFSYLLHWFHQETIPTLLYFLYIISIYLTLFITNKIKRNLDTKQLNSMLQEYKKRGESHECDRN